ncbi:MAG: hypothetical protein ACUVQH_07015 [Thermogutta sp.]
MPDCSPAQLVGYLLNALEDEEREQIEQELLRRPELRKKLQRLKRRMTILELGRVEVSPPRGLAERTCQKVFQTRQASVSGATGVSAAAMLKRLSGGGRHVCGFRLSPLADYWAGQGPNWSFADLAVGVLVVLIVVSLLFPALAEVRFRSKVLACRDNFRELSQVIHHYQNFSNIRGLEGITQANLAVVEQLVGTARWGPMFRSCPGVPEKMDRDFWANLGHNPFLLVSTELGKEEDVDSELLGYMPMIPESAGLSSWDDQVSLAAVPLWRDRPHPRDCGGWSWNHDGRGENWLFADGHVVFFRRSEGNGPPLELGTISTAAIFPDQSALFPKPRRGRFSSYQVVAGP